MGDRSRCRPGQTRRRLTRQAPDAPNLNSAFDQRDVVRIGFDPFNDEQGASDPNIERRTKDMQILVGTLITNVRLQHALIEMDHEMAIRFFGQTNDAVR